MIALSLLLAVTLSDPCAAVPPAMKPDRATAALYQKIGDAQLHQPDTSAAVYAFRRAVELDPSDEHSRLALLSLCRANGREALFQEALRRLDAGDRLGAVALLRRSQDEHPDANASLVEGIALFELGEDTEARRALEVAAADPVLAKSAQLFLGLLAARDNRDRDARQLLEDASLSEDPRIRQSAQEALRGVPPPVWLRIDASAGAGIDSNPGLSPSGNPLPGGDADGFADASVRGQWTPLEKSSPFITLGGEYRKQFVLAAFDLADVSASAGWMWRTRQFGVRGEYLFDYVAQGGDGYLLGHRVGASAWWESGLFVLSGNYSARNETFLPSDLDGFSGWRHDGGINGSLNLSPATFSVGYGLARNFAADTSWSFLEHGPRASASVRLLDSLALGLDGMFALRNYDEPVGAPQVEETIRLTATAAWWFLQDLGVRAGFSYWRNISNIPEFTATRLIGTLDLLYSPRVR